MAIRTELSLRLQNSPGALNQVCQKCCEERVNILALTVETCGTLRMVIDNTLRAVGILEEKGYGVVKKDVLFMELSNGTDSIERATRILAKMDVNVEYAYVSSASLPGTMALVVGVENIERVSMLTGI